MKGLIQLLNNFRAKGLLYLNDEKNKRKKLKGKVKHDKTTKSDKTMKSDKTTKSDKTMKSDKTLDL